VPRIRLLPGERELVRLRPSPGAFLPRYLGGVALGLWGVLLAFGPGTGGAGRAALLAAAFAGPALAGAALYLPRRRMVRLALCVLGGALAAALPAAGGDEGFRARLWMTLVAEGLAALLLAETDRRLRRYRLTNLRILHGGGLWDRTGWTLHYDAVLDLDTRQTPLGRLLGHGTIEPVLAAEAPQPLPKAGSARRRKVVPAVQRPAVPGPRPRLWGVRPLARVRRLVEAFVTDATATEFLRAEQQTQKRVGQAMQDLGRANLLR
jgi:hypothetical protein